MKDQILCPFSFIGEKVEENPDMNEMFIAGYRDKVCSDYTHSICIDEIKDEINWENPSEVQTMWMQDVKFQDTATLGDCILQYLIDNITDLTINTLIIFMQNTGMPIETIDVMVSDLHKPDGIRKKVTDILLSADLPIARIYPYIPQFQLLNIAMSGVHAKIVSQIFEEFIDKIMSMITSVGIEDFYALVFKMVYDQEPQPTSYSNMYNLCMATMREILDKQTMDFRSALMLIASNAVQMVTGAPRFGQEINNPNYRTSPEEFFENSGLFPKSAFKKLTGEFNNDNQLR